MTDSFTGIIKELERRKTAIDRALTALRGIEGIEAPAPASPASVPAVRKGKKRSAAVRKRMKEAQQLRWAKIRGDSATPSPVMTEPSKPKRRISAEGMKRIIAATKKRWRLQKTAAKPTSA
jgi:hypothetical protein